MKCNINIFFSWVAVYLFFKVTAESPADPKWRSGPLLKICKSGSIEATQMLWLPIARSPGANYPIEPTRINATWPTWPSSLNHIYKKKMCILNDMLHCIIVMWCERQIICVAISFLSINPKLQLFKQGR